MYFVFMVNVFRVLVLSNENKKKYNTIQFYFTLA
ncbi:hypothetical protein SAMN05421594_0677 [Chryseobacterium oleae]|uniref:Uncharacterized protein n=1 Tax=Chryseobacterium oleae TaxID=491207 RepID=A0A1I4VWV8_CHROL|nr:hypothetical protein SAMN05421594_0677 [Chryseobacterium oleae]